MDDQFELPVTFGKKDYNFPARFLRTGYSYKVEVEVDGETFVFEPDEERAWRAIAGTGMENVRAGRDLIAAIIDTLEELFR